MACKKIVAGPKPNPAHKGKRISQAGTQSWGRDLPGVKFGPWVCTLEEGQFCDYARSGRNSEGGLVTQTHSNRVKKPPIPPRPKRRLVGDRWED